MGIVNILAQNPCTFCGRASSGMFRESIQTGFYKKDDRKHAIYRPGPVYYYCSDHRPEFIRKSMGVNYGLWLQQTQRLFKGELAKLRPSDTPELVKLFEENKTPLDVVEHLKPSSATYCSASDWLPM